MKIIKRRYNHWIPKLLKVGGITLYPYILFKRTPADLVARGQAKSILKHEYVHINQVRRLGFFTFYTTYIWFNLTKGYRNNPFEIEAYGTQLEPFNEEEQIAYNEDFE